MSSPLKQDPIELVILSVLEPEPLYGYAISKAVKSRSDGQMTLSAGVLYPTLSRLEKSRLITASWEEINSERAEPGSPGRRRKWYSLTPKGHKYLAQRIAAHRAFQRLMDSFIAATSLEEAGS
jgi:DNA-binding PadR family transcriptional regulator